MEDFDEDAELQAKIWNMFAKERARNEGTQGPNEMQESSLGISLLSQIKAAKNSQLSTASYFEASRDKKGTIS